MGIQRLGAGFLIEDIKNTQAIWRVLKGGWVFDPEELQPPRN